MSAARRRLLVRRDPEYRAQQEALVQAAKERERAREAEVLEALDEL